MDKFLKIGEQYIQWIALALGVGWLGLMAFLYLAQPPLAVDLGNGRPLQPGEVDTTLKTPLEDVDKKVTSTDVNVHWGTMNPAQEIAFAVGGTPPTIFVASSGPTRPTGPTQPDTRPTGQPTLVSAPAALVGPADPSLGTSILSLPQPGAPPAGPAGAPAQLVMANQDHDWSDNGFLVKWEDLKKAFDAAHIPQNRARALFLKVELQRQELSPSGQAVGIPVSIPQELIVQDAQAVPPWPDDKGVREAMRDEKVAFETWAASNQALILDPPFPGVTLGTPYYRPGDPKPQDAFNAAAAPVAPVAPVAPPVLAPAPGRGVPIRPGVNGPPPPPGRMLGPAGPPGYPAGRYPIIPRAPYPGPAAAPGVPAAPAMPNRPPDFNIPQVGANGEPSEFPGLDPAAMIEAAQANPANPANPAAPAAPGAQGQPAPPPGLTILAHDWTVQAGKTYLYRVRYWLANPLYLTQMGSKEVQNTWAVASPYSAWSKPVSIPSRFEFFVQKLEKKPGNATTPVDVAVEVFTKKPDAPGGVTREIIHLTPGDPIAGSGSMIIDVRPDPKNRLQFKDVLISDATGHVEHRDVESDKNNPRHTELNDRAGGTAAAAP